MLLISCHNFEYPNARPNSSLTVEIDGVYKWDTKQVPSRWCNNYHGTMLPSKIFTNSVLKVIVHPKITILSSFTHLTWLLSSAEHKRSYFEVSAAFKNIFKSLGFRLKLSSPQQNIKVMWTGSE